MNLLKVLSWEILVKVGKILLGKFHLRELGISYLGKLCCPYLLNKILEKFNWENFEYLTWEILLGKILKILFGKILLPMFGLAV